MIGTRSIFMQLQKLKVSRIELRNFRTNMGLFFEDPQLIRQEITEELSVRYKSSRLTPPFPGNLFLIENHISDSEKCGLIANPTNKKIKDALFDLSPDKSPGPDGFPADFFQHYWATVGPSVCNAVKAFFHSGQMVKETNQTFISLIPKTDNPITIDHFRPISLCNTTFKSDHENFSK